MLDRLPELIDPLSFADKRKELVGQLELGSLDRLFGIITNTAGKVSVDLKFGKEGSLATIVGRIHTVLTIQCQNCLQDMEWPIDSEIKLGIVSSIDEADRLPADFEPILVGNEKIPFKEIVEEELLLSLPTFPKHSEPCMAFDVVSNCQEASDNKPSNLNNPFSILAKIKTTGDN